MFGISETLWVAGLSGSFILLGALLPQWLMARREERRRKLEWERDRVEQARTRREQWLRELWEWALATEARMINKKDISTDWVNRPPYEQTPSFASGKVYAIALQSLPDVRLAAKEFHRATKALDPIFVPSNVSPEEHGKNLDRWVAAFKSLEGYVEYLADLHQH